MLSPEIRQQTTVGQRDRCAPFSARARQAQASLVKSIILGAFVILPAYPAAAQIPPAQAQTRMNVAIETANAARVVLFSDLHYLSKGTPGPAPGADELEALASLHKRIDKNPTFQTVLKAAGLTTDDVVAVSMSQVGVLSLFIDDL